MAFKNRIVHFGEKPADQFAANPDNPRIHPQIQREAMEAALTEIGWLAPVIENARTGYLIDGHERVMQALLDNSHVPYVQVYLTEDEEALALATFDPIGELAYYDDQQMNRLIQQIDTESQPLQRLLDQLGGKTAPPDAPTPETDPTSDSPTICPCCGAKI